jgi:hypothetical protein
MKKWRIFMLNDHDPHHDNDYRNWAENAKVNGREETFAIIKEGEALRCYWRLRRVSKSLEVNWI